MAAVLSPCGRYRYWLERRYDLPLVDGITERAPPPVFVMLNPSTADADRDDPTIRRCWDFARRWGADSFQVVNLYGLRATKPRDLWAADDPVGPDNDGYLRDAVRDVVGRMVVAWGTHARPDRVRTFRRIAAECGRTLWCLRSTASGAPGHPLYVPGDTALVRWDDATTRSDLA